MSGFRRLVDAGILLLFAGILWTGAVFLTAEREERTAGGPEREDAGDTCVITMTYPYYGEISRLKGLEEIQEAVNEITRDKIGVEVELLPVDMENNGEEYLLRLGRGEPMDLMLIRGEDVASYADKGMLTPLNSYLKRSARQIDRLNDRRGGILTANAEQQGRIYGVASLSGHQASGYGLWISRERLEETGIVWRENHIYTLEEIDFILANLKERYPDSYPLGQITSGQMASSAFFYTDMGDPLGRDPLTGTVREENDRVVNPFETEEYRGFLSRMRRWYEAEYIYPDSATYDASVMELLRKGKIFMIPASSYPGTFDLLAGEETDYVCLKTTEVCRTPGTAGYWTIPVTSRYPEKAAQFLDLCYSDDQILYLLNYGLSGKDYRVTDWERNLLEPIRDGEGRAAGFYNPFAWIGDTEDLYVYGSAGDAEQIKNYVVWAESETGRYRGFVYNTAGCSRQIDEVKQVLQEYLPVLESGSVSLEENYDVFLERLREAGIDDILRDKQSQLDVWLIRQGLVSDSGSETGQ